MSATEANTGAQPVNDGSDHGLLRGRVRRTVDMATQLLGMVAIVCIAFMLLATVADVIRRYLWGESIHGVTELGEVAMVAIVYLGLGYAQSRDDHVAMTLVIKRIRPDIAAILNAIALLVATLIVAWLLLVTTDRAIESYAISEYRFGIVEIPVWPARIAVAVGVAAYLIELLFAIWDDIRVAVRSRGRHSAEPVESEVGSF